MRQKQDQRQIQKEKEVSEIKKWRTSLTEEHLHLTPRLPELAPGVFFWVNFDSEEQSVQNSHIFHVEDNHQHQEQQEEEYLNKFSFIVTFSLLESTLVLTQL